MNPTMAAAVASVALGPGAALARDSDIAVAAFAANL